MSDACAHLFVGFCWKAIRGQFGVAPEQEVVALANVTFAIIGAAKDFAMRLHQATGVNVEHGVGQMKDDEADGNLFQANLEGADDSALRAICSFLGVDPVDPFPIERTWLDRLLGRKKMRMGFQEKVELALCRGMDDHIHNAIESALARRAAE